MIYTSSNQFGHFEIYSQLAIIFFFFFFLTRYQFSFIHTNKGRNKKLKSTSFTHCFFLDQNPTTKLELGSYQQQHLAFASWLYLVSSLNNHKELGIALYFAVQRNMYVSLMERYFILFYLIFCNQRIRVEALMHWHCCHFKVAKTIPKTDCCKHLKNYQLEVQHLIHFNYYYLVATFTDGHCSKLHVPSSQLYLRLLRRHYAVNCFQAFLSSQIFSRLSRSFSWTSDRLMLEYLEISLRIWLSHVVFDLTADLFHVFTKAFSDLLGVSEGIIEVTKPQQSSFA